MALRPAMTAWYNPPQLIRIAVRVVISTIFGEFADKRETLAAMNPIDPGKLDHAYDYSNQAAGDFWFDYMADTGDGWNSTYAMARLVCAPQIALAGGQELPRGQILVLGGDQVYPTASRDDYQRKLRDPFDKAALQAGMTPEECGDIYAIPGNHDWYDGLDAFSGIFCRRRAQGAWSVERHGTDIGGRITKQTRSYFAIKLPGKWWLWAADIQLTDFIDQAQVDFFQHVANEWMEDGSSLIICSGKPSWEYCRNGEYDPSFPSFSYLERLATLARARNKTLTVKLLLSGDSHHYARYCEDDRQYITCGGGGAFLHPTHHLPKSIEFDWRFAKPGEQNVDGKKYTRSFTLGAQNGQDSLYPPAKISQMLAFRNLAFAVLNVSFTATIFCLYAILSWQLSISAQASGLGPFVHAISTSPDFLSALGAYGHAFFAGPVPTIFVSMSCGAYIYAADMRTTLGRVAVGLAHAVVQNTTVVFVTCACIRIAASYLGALSLPLSALVSASATATMFGLYLLLMLNVFKRHWNEAFSSLRIRHYKSFLRIRIAQDGSLAVFPVGLEHVPAESRLEGSPCANEVLKPHLIEGLISIPPQSNRS